MSVALETDHRGIPSRLELAEALGALAASNSAKFKREAEFWVAADLVSGVFIVSRVVAAVGAALGFVHLSGTL